MQNSKKNHVVVSKMTKILWIFIRTLICTLICPFCAKCTTFDLKKYKEVIFHDTEESCKIWRKTDLWFGKWHEEFGKFSPEHSKISKICTLMSCFWPKYIMFELKKVQRSYVWWHWRLMQNLKENWLVLSKMTWEIWQVCIGWIKCIAHLTNFYTCLTELLCK